MQKQQCKKQKIYRLQNTEKIHRSVLYKPLLNANLGKVLLFFILLLCLHCPIHFDSHDLSAKKVSASEIILYIAHYFYRLCKSDETQPS